jgi:uncharacterized protein (DUF302 family)
MSALSFDVTLPLAFAPAVERVTAALQAEGFGVLTRADVHTAFREKLGREFRPYTILGACNPSLAHTALSARPDAGLLLPCNVIVEETGPGTSQVRIVDPDAMMRSAGFELDPVLAGVGGEAAARLRRVADALRA